MSAVHHQIGQSGVSSHRGLLGDLAELPRGRFGELLTAPTMRPAGLLQRAAAYVLDFVIIAVGLFVVGLFSSLVVSFAQSSSPTAGVVTALALFTTELLAIVAYFVVGEAKTGATLGKHALGLMVVRTDGGDIGYREAVLRNVLRLVDALPFLSLTALISMASSDRNQRVGDRIAKTMVIKL